MSKKAETIKITSQYRLFVRTCGHVSIRCTEDGFEVRRLGQSRHTKGFLFKAQSDFRIAIPKFLQDAYGLERSSTLPITTINNDTFFVHCKCHGEVPSPIGVGYNNHTPIDIDDMVFEEKIKMVSPYRLEMPRILRGCDYIKATMWIGKVQCIELSAANQKDIERIPSMETYVEYYGANLQNFAGLSMTFIQHNMTYKTKRRVIIPKFFQQGMKLITGSTLNVYSSETGNKVLVVPDSQICALSGEKIKPSKDAGEVLKVCEECKEETDDMQEIYALMNEIKDMASDYKERQKQRSEKTAFQKQAAKILQEMNQVNSRMEDLIRIMTLVE